MRSRYSRTSSVVRWMTWLAMMGCHSLLPVVCCRIVWLASNLVGAGSPVMVLIITWLAWVLCVGYRWADPTLGGKAGPILSLLGLATLRDGAGTTFLIVGLATLGDGAWWSVLSALKISASCLSSANHSIPSWANGVVGVGFWRAAISSFAAKFALSVAEVAGMRQSVGKNSTVSLTRSPSVLTIWTV
jgi:hypothetical protein